MAAAITVAVVDDHPLFRTGVVRTLELDSMISFVAEGDSTAQAIDIAATRNPDVMLLDISMPGDGIAALRDIAAMPDGPKVAMLTVSENDDHVVRSLEAGAVGYILKGIAANDLIHAVKNIAAGESFVSPNLTLRLLSHMRATRETSAISMLSPQEQKILRLVAQGKSNREIGAELGVHEKTVKFHMTRIMDKLGVRNRVEATRLAHKEWDL
jgi:two-component system, NarL family, nitrate/nitrite response regulator NarL